MNPRTTTTSSRRSTTRPCVTTKSRGKVGPWRSLWPGRAWNWKFRSMARQGDTLLPATETLRCRTTNGLPSYRFRLLGGCSGLRHAVFTRLGGVSSAPFASLNVSYDTQDDAGKVRENLRRVRTATGSASLVYARQIHGGTLLALHERAPLDPGIPYALEGID